MTDDGAPKIASRRALDEGWLKPLLVAVALVLTSAACASRDTAAVTPPGNGAPPEGRIVWQIPSSSFGGRAAATAGRIAIVQGSTLALFDVRGQARWSADATEHTPAVFLDAVFGDAGAGIFVAGVENGGVIDGRGKGQPLFVARYDSDGKRMFRRAFDPGRQGGSTRIAANRRGAFALLYTPSLRSTYSVRRFTPSGEDGVEHTFLGTSDHVTIALDDDDGLYVASPESIVKLSPSGDVLFRQLVPEAVSLPSLALGRDGRAVVGASCRGRVAFLGRSIELPSARYSACVAALGSDGRATWLHAYGGGVRGGVYVSEVVVGHDGAIAIAGSTQFEVDFLSGYSLRETPFVLALDRGGAPSWAKRLGPSEVVSRMPSSIAIDDAGQLIVTGRAGGELALALTRP